MKRFLWFAVFLLILTACGGRGVYLYENRADPYGGPDRPWLIIGARGAGSAELEDKLCRKGELRQILSEAGVRNRARENLFLAACGPRASAERFLEIYYALPDETRLRLKETFEKHGYSLNDYGC